MQNIENQAKNKTLKILKILSGFLDTSFILIILKIRPLLHCFKSMRLEGSITRFVSQITRFVSQNYAFCQSKQVFFYVFYDNVCVMRNFEYICNLNLT